LLYKQASRNSCKSDDQTTATSSPLKMNTLPVHLIMETQLTNMNKTGWESPKSTRRNCCIPSGQLQVSFCPGRGGSSRM